MDGGWRMLCCRCGWIGFDLATNQQGKGHGHGGAEGDQGDAAALGQQFTRGFGPGRALHWTASRFMAGFQLRLTRTAAATLHQL
ncbi:MAG: hypothetical protein DCF29_03755, partial [Alphaproteobacteria bacterium]